MSKKLMSLANFPTLGPGDKIAEGDSSVQYDLLSTDESTTIFDELKREVAWQKMYHAAGEVPRLVAVQGSVDTRDGSKPIYRHPSDQSPPLLKFTPVVLKVKEASEKIIGHELNHVLIQLYRDGKDYISEHADKTLDIVPGSSIVNASFGARRTMRLRRKRGVRDEKETEDTTAKVARETQRVHMPHNSLFVLGLTSNRRWLHGINADKRLPADRAADELAFGGERISLTFRRIGTFLSQDEKLIWGQGAKGKTKKDARPVLAGDANETQRLVDAMGRENQGEEDGSVVYEGGFDVLHFAVVEVDKA
jgi:alkylated DNA repair dioxygenase AlkB